MTRLTIIWTLFTIVMTMNQVTARDFIKQALRNLEKYQTQHKLQDKKQKDDSDHAVNPNSFLHSYSVGPALYFNNVDLNQKQIQQRDDSGDDSSLQELRNLLEQALDAGDERYAQGKKKNSKVSLLRQLSAVDLDNLILQNRILKKRKHKSLLEMLGASKKGQPSSDDFKDSQVLMILDADTLETDSEDRLDDLVSALLKSSASSHKDLDGPPEYRYKGFRVKVPRNSYRKARGDSNEKYASDDDGEIVRPVKRPRAYVGKGRTAIPYIRNRGDIYEKDY